MKVNLNNIEKLTAAIDAAQGKCRIRLLDVDDLDFAVEHAEFCLTEAGIPKKAWKGVTVFVNFHTVSMSYQFPPEGTVATIQRFASGWFVTAISRAPARRNGDNVSPRVTFPRIRPKDAGDLIEAMMRKHSIALGGVIDPEFPPAIDEKALARARAAGRKLESMIDEFETRNK